MDIRKSKVEKNCKWSANTQKVLASFLGVSAVSMLAACVPSDVVVGADAGMIPPTSSDGSYIPSGDVVDLDETGQSSSSPSPESSSSSESRPQSSSSSINVPPLTAGIVAPESSISNEVSSSSRHVDISYPMSSGGVMYYTTSSSSVRSSSSSPLPVTSGVPMSYQPVSSSSSYKIDSLQTTAGEVYVEPESSSSSESEPLAGIPELSSSSSEPEPLPGDPIELPEPLSGDVAEPEPMSGGAFGPQQFSGDATESED